MSRCLVLPLLATLLLPTAATGNPAPSAPPDAPGDSAKVREQVRTLVREAGQLMDRGDRAGAADRLLQAQKLHPDPSLDYNLGIVYAEWGKPPEAAAALSRFLFGVKKEAVTHDRLEDARHRLEGYREQLAQLRIEASDLSPSAAVFLNRVPLGNVPLRETQWLRPATYELRVSAPAHRDYTVTLSLQAGEERSVSAQLAPLHDTSVEPGALVPTHDLVLLGVTKPKPVYRTWWFWTAVGGTAVAVISAALIGAGAAGRFDRPPPGTDLPPLDVGR